MCSLKNSKMTRKWHNQKEIPTPKTEVGKKLKSKNLPLIMVFRRKCCMADKRQSVLMSKSQSQFVLIGPAKNLKIGH